MPTPSRLPPPSKPRPPPPTTDAQASDVPQFVPRLKLGGAAWDIKNANAPEQARTREAAIVDEMFDEESSSSDEDDAASANSDGSIELISQPNVHDVEAIIVEESDYGDIGDIAASLLACTGAYHR